MKLSNQPTNNNSNKQNESKNPSQGKPLPTPLASVNQTVDVIKEIYGSIDFINKEVLSSMPDTTRIFPHKITSQKMPKFPLPESYYASMNISSNYKSKDNTDSNKYSLVKLVKSPDKNDQSNPNNTNNLNSNLISDGSGFNNNNNKIRRNSIFSKSDVNMNLNNLNNLTNNISNNINNINYPNLNLLYRKDDGNQSDFKNNINNEKELISIYSNKYCYTNPNIIKILNSNSNNNNNNILNSKSKKLQLITDILNKDQSLTKKNNNNITNLNIIENIYFKKLNNKQFLSDDENINPVSSNNKFKKIKFHKKLNIEKLNSLGNDKKNNNGSVIYTDNFKIIKKNNEGNGEIFDDKELKEASKSIISIVNNVVNYNNGINNLNGKHLKKNIDVQMNKTNYNIKYYIGNDLLNNTEISKSFKRSKNKKNQIMNDVLISEQEEEDSDENKKLRNNKLKSNEEISKVHNETDSKNRKKDLYNNYFSDKDINEGNDKHKSKSKSKNKNKNTITLISNLPGKGQIKADCTIENKGMNKEIKDININYNIINSQIIRKNKVLNKQNRQVIDSNKKSLLSKRKKMSINNELTDTPLQQVINKDNINTKNSSVKPSSNVLPGINTNAKILNTESDAELNKKIFDDSPKKLKNNSNIAFSQRYKKCKIKSFKNRKTNLTSINTTNFNSNQNQNIMENTQIRTESNFYKINKIDTEDKGKNETTNYQSVLDNRNFDVSQFKLESKNDSVNSIQENSAKNVLVKRKNTLNLNCNLMNKLQIHDENTNEKIIEKKSFKGNQKLLRKKTVIISNTINEIKNEQMSPENTSQNKIHGHLNTHTDTSFMNSESQTKAESKIICPSKSPLKSSFKVPPIKIKQVSTFTEQDHLPINSNIQDKDKVNQVHNCTTSILNSSHSKQQSNLNVTNTHITHNTQTSIIKNSPSKSKQQTPVVDQNSSSGNSKYKKLTSSKPKVESFQKNKLLKEITRIAINQHKLHSNREDSNKTYSLSSLESSISQHIAEGFVDDIFSMIQNAESKDKQLNRDYSFEEIDFKSSYYISSKKDCVIDFEKKLNIKNRILKKRKKKIDNFLTASINKVQDILNFNYLVMKMKRLVPKSDENEYELQNKKNIILFEEDVNYSILYIDKKKNVDLSGQVKDKFIAKYFDISSDLNTDILQDNSGSNGRQKKNNQRSSFMANSNVKLDPNSNNAQNQNNHQSLFSNNVIVPNNNKTRKKTIRGSKSKELVYKKRTGEMAKSLIDLEKLKKKAILDKENYLYYKGLIGDDIIYTATKNKVNTLFRHTFLSSNIYDIRHHEQSVNELKIISRQSSIRSGRMLFGRPSNKNVYYKNLNSSNISFNNSITKKETMIFKKKCGNYIGLNKKFNEDRFKEREEEELITYRNNIIEEDNVEENEKESKETIKILLENVKKDKKEDIDNEYDSDYVLVQKIIDPNTRKEKKRYHKINNICNSNINNLNSHSVVTNQNSKGILEKYGLKESIVHKEVEKGIKQIKMLKREKIIHSRKIPSFNFFSEDNHLVTALQTKKLRYKYFDSLGDDIYKQLIFYINESDSFKISKILKANNGYFNLNYQDIYGNTFLIHAVINENIEIVEMLLEAGCNPNVGNKNQNYPLHYAITLKNYPIANKLIQFGANESICNKMGMDPWQCAGMNIDEL